MKRRTLRPFCNLGRRISASTPSLPEHPCPRQHPLQPSDQPCTTSPHGRSMALFTAAATLSSPPTPPRPGSQRHVRPPRPQRQPMAVPLMRRPHPHLHPGVRRGVPAAAPREMSPASFTAAARASRAPAGPEGRRQCRQTHEHVQALCAQAKAQKIGFHGLSRADFPTNKYF